MVTKLGWSDDLFFVSHSLKPHWEPLCPPPTCRESQFDSNP